MTEDLPYPDSTRRASARIGSVCVAIPSWNGRRHLDACLEALRHQRPTAAESCVSVFDNGSTDGTAAWLASDHPTVRVLTTEANIGFAAACNRLVAATDADAVVFLNNDTRPEPEWLASLVDALDAAPPDVAAVSGLVVDWTGRRLDFGGGVMTFDGHAFQRDRGRPIAGVSLPDRGGEIPFACGANMIVRRADFVALGGFDAEYFAYFEDVDLGWRIWAAGSRVTFAPESKVRHRSMATSRRLGNAQRGFLFERNAYVTACKNYDDEHWPRLQPVIQATLVARAAEWLERAGLSGAELNVGTGDEPGASSGVDPVAEAASGGETSWWRQLAGRLRAAVGPRRQRSLSDPRARAQLRLLPWIAAHRDRLHERRRSAQATRMRPDAEIFERFPLYVVPTYPGDERLFESRQFRELWPAGIPVVHESLERLVGTP